MAPPLATQPIGPAAPPVQTGQPAGAGMIPPVAATSPAAPVQPSNYTGGGGMMAPVNDAVQGLYNRLGVPQAVQGMKDAAAQGDVGGYIGQGLHAGYASMVAPIVALAGGVGRLGMTGVESIARGLVGTPGAPGTAANPPGTAVAKNFGPTVADAQANAFAQTPAYAAATDPQAMRIAAANAAMYGGGFGGGGGMPPKLSDAQMKAVMAFKGVTNAQFPAAAQAYLGMQAEAPKQVLGELMAKQTEMQLKSGVPAATALQNSINNTRLLAGAGGMVMPLPQQTE